MCQGHHASINVKDFGAKGNARDDDTAAIQAAESAAASGRGAALFFPPGTYRFSHTITATTILGHNRQKTILHYTGSGDAVGNGGGLKYHRKFESITVRGEGVGVGLNLDSSPAGSYRNMIVQNFGTGIYLNGGSTLYNIFDDVTVQSTGTGVKIDGLAHESRFKNFRINFAQIGVDIVGAGRTVIDSSSIENCSQYGVVVRDRGPGRNVATTLVSSRFEFNPVNIRIEPNVSKTAIIACHPVGGITEDLGVDTTHVGTDGSITTARTVKGRDIEGERFTGSTGRFGAIHNQSSFNNSRVQLHETGTVVDRNRDGAGIALRVNLSHDTATGSILDVQRKSATVARVTNTGHLAIRAAAAPISVDVVAGEAQFWVDATDGAARLMVTAKQADGTVVSGAIPLVLPAP